MPVAPAALGDSVADMLAARGIHYHPLFTFQEPRPETQRDRRLRRPRAPGRPADRRPAPPGTRGRPLVSAPRASPASSTSTRGRCRPTTTTSTRSETWPRSSCPTARRCPRQASSPTPRRRWSQSGSRTATAARAPTPSFDGHGYCWIELGDGRAGFAGGNFYAEPEPQVKLRRPGPPAPLGQGRVREVVAPPLALADAQRPASKEARQSPCRPDAQPREAATRVSRAHSRPIGQFASDA